MSSCKAAVFDVSTTLAFVQLSADSKRIATLQAYPGATNILHELHAKDVRLGVRFGCTEIPEEELRERLASGGVGDLARVMTVVPRGTDLLGVFKDAAAKFNKQDGCEKTRLVFVSGVRIEQEIARRAGFKTVPVPELAAKTLEGGGRLRYLRIRIPAGTERAEWMPVLRDHGAVPLHIATEPADGGATVLYVTAHTRTAAALDDLGFRVERLGAPDAPSRSTLYLLRDDLQVKTGFLHPGGNASKLFAIGRAASSLLASTEDGLLVALSSDTHVESLCFEDSQDSHARRLSPSMNRFEGRRRVALRDPTLVQAAKDKPLEEDELKILRRYFKPQTLKTTVDKYIVVGNGQTGGTYGSRRVTDAGNKVAVEMLVSDLSNVASKQLSNRFTVGRHCYPESEELAANVLATLEASAEMDRAVVVVGAHLDSTSNAKEAPGADDDASGMAAVLEMAEAFVELSQLGKPHREVRFVLFNGEEAGMTGSQLYAEAQAELGVEIAAMFQIDMIGYDHEDRGILEVHAGLDVAAPDPAAVERSMDQAKLIEHLLKLAPRLKAIEIFPPPDDPGADRSDHHRFHVVGYPGCWVAENFYPLDMDSKPLNPAYHSASDTKIDEDYAADIARLVAAAAWIAATR